MDRSREAKCAGRRALIVRYADDAVIGFQNQYEAEKFLQELREQLRRQGLEPNEEKTRLIRFGRYARQNREERGKGNRSRSPFWDSAMYVRKTV